MNPIVMATVNIANPNTSELLLIFSNISRFGRRVYITPNREDFISRYNIRYKKPYTAEREIAVYPSNAAET